MLTSAAIGEGPDIGDPSGGWEAVATRFATIRSDTGSDIVRRWSECLPPGGAVVDIGCGTGLPVSRTLATDGCVLYGINPSPALLSHATGKCWPMPR